MEHYEQLRGRQRKLAVVGLGYVGFPLAAAFAERMDVIGFDTNREKIEQYRRGIDPTGELYGRPFDKLGILFTDRPERLREACFIVVAVPTPVYEDKVPNLELLRSACRIVGRHMAEDTVVVFESTVHPGTTEGMCVSELERASGLTCGRDFFVGYSPERINPGDAAHSLCKVTKIVSGMNEETLDVVAKVYDSILDADQGGKIYRAESIRVAEAAKIAENAQRDVNIAFLNELALLFHRIDLDTADVLRAMGSKWNALHFQPGLVGGHCISVDSYYLIHEARRLGVRPSVMAESRERNESLAPEIGAEIVREMMVSGRAPGDMRVVMLGAAFKGNCNDLRNTKALVLKRLLESYGFSMEIVDPWVDPEQMLREFGQAPIPLEQAGEADCLIFTTDHREFAALKAEDVAGMLAPEGCQLVVDIRNLFRRREIEALGCRYWNL